MAFDPDGNSRIGETGTIQPHTGIAGIGDLTVADHGWTGAVATIEVFAVPGAPSTGSAGLRAESSGGQNSLWFVLGGALLVLSATTLFTARRFSTSA